MGAGHQDVLDSEGRVIHYHGTPVGGSRQDAARFLMGRPAAALLIVMVAAGVGV